MIWYSMSEMVKLKSISSRWARNRQATPYLTSHEILSWLTNSNKIAFFRPFWKVVPLHQVLIVHWNSPTNAKFIVLGYKVNKILITFTSDSSCRNCKNAGPVHYTNLFIRLIKFNLILKKGRLQFAKMSVNVDD